MECGSTILHNVESLIRDEEAGDYLLCQGARCPTRLGLNMKAQKNILFASNSGSVRDEGRQCRLGTQAYAG
ncbi:MAG: hypothetical protein ACLTW9_06670 [Enterocloster sp.]